MTSPGQRFPLARGALVTIDASRVQSAIRFQYNPDTVRRTLEPNTVGGKPGSRSRAVRFAGAPAETLTIDCRFSSSDGLDAGDVDVAEKGIAPQLAALALLTYPRLADVQAAQSKLDSGAVEVVPALADELVFVFGGRVLPCEIEAFSIVEQLYDNHLTPVMATVTLTLRVVSYSDVDSDNPAYARFTTYQKALEDLASPVYDHSGPGI